MKTRVQTQVQEEQITFEVTVPKLQKANTKMPTFSDCLVKGAYIDAKDTTNQWLLAQIVERDDSEHQIKINYDGWSHKWDEWFSFSSEKIAHFRKHSQGYTGQVGHAIRDWDFDIEDLEKRSTKMDDIISKDIVNSFDSPYELTQTLRGSEFIYLDSLLQHEYENPQEEFPAAVHYFVMHFRFYIKLLKMIPELLPEYKEGLSNNEAFLTNKRIAAINCLHEAIDSVNKIFGPSQRCWKFLSAHDKEDIPIKISKTREFAGKDYEVSYFGSLGGEEEDLNPKYSHLMVELINAFGELGGFDEWIRVFEYNSKTSQLNPLPFEIMMLMLTNISAIHTYLNQSFVADFIPRIKGALIRRFRAINIQEIKEIDQTFVLKLLQEAQSLLCKYPKPEEIYEFTETVQLELAIKFLSVQRIEKRLADIKWIREIAKKVATSEEYQKQGNAQIISTSPESTKYLNVTIFGELLLRNNTFEIILGDSIHPEIVKESGEVLYLLVKYEAMPLKLIDLIWSSCEGKSEAAVKAIIDVIIKISPVLTREAVQSLRTKILSIPHERFTEMHLNLIKNVAMNTLPTGLHALDQEPADAIIEMPSFENKSSDLREEVNESDFFCLSLLWDLLSDDSKADTQIAECALTTLSGILKERACKKLRRLSLFRCFEKLQRNESVSQCINLAHYLLSNTYYAVKTDHPDSLSSVLAELDQKFSIIELIISDMENYHSKVKKILESEREYSKSNSALREKLLIGKYSYHVNFNNRFVFLEFMILNPCYLMELSEEHIERLWYICVLTPLFDYDQSYFLKWISPEKSQRMNESLVGIKKISFFFQEILSNKSKLDYENLTQAGFECFESHFKFFNRLENNFKIDNIDGKFKAINPRFHGKEQMWEMFLLCKNKAVRESIMDFIINCYLQPAAVINLEKDQIREEFLLKCMVLLNEAREKQDDEQLFKIVLILLKFFKKSQEEDDEKTSVSSNSKLIDLLFSLLPSAKPENAKLIWDLLMGIPQDTRIELNAWENIFETQDIYRLLYCLRIVENFVSDRELEENPDWVTKFIKKGGIQHLLSKLISFPEPIAKNLYSLMTAGLILKLVVYFQTQTQLQLLYGSDFHTFSTQLIQRLLEIMNEVCQSSLVREKAEADSEKDAKAERKITTRNNTYLISEASFYETTAIKYALTLAAIIFDVNPKLLDLLYQYKNLENCISAGLVESSNGYLQEIVSAWVLQLSTNFLHNSHLSYKPHQFFIPFLLHRTLEQPLLKQENSDVFFKLISDIIALGVKDIAKEVFNIDDVLSKLVGYIKNESIGEINAQEPNGVLAEILRTVRLIFLKHDKKGILCYQYRELVKELLQNSFFRIEKALTHRTIRSPKYKSLETRSAAFKLLSTLARGYDENLLDITTFIAPLHTKASWRTNRHRDWYLMPNETVKSRTGYAGLKNLGCMSLLNSQIQQLYMIPEFRRAVLTAEDLIDQTIPREENILYQLKRLFYGLSHTKKQAFNPKGICRAFKNVDKNPLDALEQMDPEEFLTQFMECLKNLMQGTKGGQSIAHLFEGVMSNELIAQNDENPLSREREESFLTIGLPIKNKKTMDQGLSTLIESETLEGENAYFWDEIGQKCKTLKLTCLKRLPNHLIFVLKRFELDYNTMQREKINDYFEFPNRINLEPYTQQGLKKARQKNEVPYADKLDLDELPPEYFDYKLTGIIIHEGSLESGHYYSLIQNRATGSTVPEDQSWLKFDDKIVSAYNPKDIPSDAFGADEKYTYDLDNGDVIAQIQETRNAFILFYERVTPFKNEQIMKSNIADVQVHEEYKQIESKKERKITSDLSGEQVTNEFLEEIYENNRNLLAKQNVLSKEYSDFISELVHRREFTPNLRVFKDISVIEKGLGLASRADFELLKTGIIYLLTSTLRDKCRRNIIQLLPTLKGALRKNVPASQWLVHNFTSKKVIIEFFLDNPVQKMRNLAVGFVTSAFRTVYENEIKGNSKILYQKHSDAFPTSMTANFINCCISIMFERKHNSHYTQFFKIFYEMARCGPEIAEYLIKHKLIGRLLDFFSDKSSPYNAFFRGMDDVMYVENQQPEIGTQREVQQQVCDQKEVENYSTSLEYFWQTLCYLVRHCRLNKLESKHCLWQIAEIDSKLLPQEIVLLMPESFFVEKALGDCTHKISIKNTTLLYSYLCYEDTTFTDTYIEAIEKGLDKEVKELKPFFKALYTLSLLEDSLSDKRCDRLCEILCKVAKDSIKYYLETDAFTSFVYKCVTRNKRIRAWFSSHKDSWSWMLEWLHRNPPQGVIEAGMEIQHRKLGLREMKGHFALKNRRFEKMLEDSIENCENDWDSDDDLSEWDFQVGQQIDYLDLSTNKWVTATVETRLEELMNISYNAGEGLEYYWANCDSQLLAPLNTMKAHQELIETEGIQVEQAEAADSESD